ncbi:MAG TPA: iron-sulfur cluster assembly accessory protein [Verrucomicrobiales bacterium]|nr:iron-sulfur cluster assembly accessory protein [Verrucomicrobiales bacterium]
MIHVTDEAAHELSLLLEGETSGRGLRLRVQKGGCAGLQYDLSIDFRQAGDAVVETPGGPLFLDPGSAAFLRGSTVTHSSDLSDSGFKIVNPNAARSCGCGTSFEPAGVSTKFAGSPGSENDRPD